MCGRLVKIQRNREQEKKIYILTGKKEQLDASYYVSYGVQQQSQAMEHLASGNPYPYNSSNAVANRHLSNLRMRNAAGG